MLKLPYVNWQHISDVLGYIPESKNMRVDIGNGNATLFTWQGADFADTSVQMGSLSKQATVVMVMRMIEEGYFGLDEKVNKWLDFWPVDPSDNRSHITVRHCLTMTTGFVSGNMMDVDVDPEITDEKKVVYELGNNSDWPFGLAYQTDCTDIDPSTCAFRVLEGVHAGFPGEIFAYSCDHWHILGAVASEAAGGEDLNSLLRRFVFNRTTPPLECAYLGPNKDIAGDIWMAPEELSRFKMAFLRGELLGPDSMREIHSDQLEYVGVKTKLMRFQPSRGKWSYGLGTWIRAPGKGGISKAVCGESFACFYLTAWYLMSFTLSVAETRYDGSTECPLPVAYWPNGCLISIDILVADPKDGQGRKPGTEGYFRSMQMRQLSNALNTELPFMLSNGTFGGKEYGPDGQVPARLAWLPRSGNHNASVVLVTVNTLLSNNTFQMAGYPGMTFANIGVGLTWEGPMTKVQAYCDWLNHQVKSDPDQLVIIADSSDVIYGNCSREEVLERYRLIVAASNGAPVVFGGQFRLFPSRIPHVYDAYNARRPQHDFVQRVFEVSDADYAPFENKTACAKDKSWVSCSDPPSLQYLNSGFAMGPAKELQIVFNRIRRHKGALNVKHHYDDQKAAHLTLIDRPDLVTVDSSGTLVIDLVHTKPGIFEVRPSSLWNKVARRAQCFVHGNGDGFDQFLQIVDDIGLNRPLTEKSTSVFSAVAAPAPSAGADGSPSPKGLLHV